MQIARRLEAVRGEIARAAERSGRSFADITLVAVSKKKSIDEMREYQVAAEALGIPVVFGENYLQELKAKKPLLASAALVHMIGPLQSNKVRDAVALCDVVESVHSVKTLELVAKEARHIGKKQAIFLQVNIGQDAAKSGFAADEISAIVKCLSQYADAVEVLGLMTITPYYEIPEQARGDFKRMSRLRADLYAGGGNTLFANETILLSMGMSADFEIAIEEGADLVRIGTALFGER